MKRILLFLIIGCTLFANENNRSIHHEIEERLKFIEDSYFPHLGHEERREAILAVDEIMALIQKMEITETDNTPFLKSKSFIALRKKVHGDKSDKIRTTRIKSELKTKWISSAQLKELIQYFDSEKAAEACIRSVYSRVYDKVNFIDLIMSLKSQKTRAFLMEFALRETKLTEWDKKPEYNNLSEDTFILVNDMLSKTTFDKDKMKLITMLSRTGYFSAIQLEDMINYLDFEQNRIDCIKEVFSSVTDKENRDIVLRTIDSNSKRKALEFYFQKI